MQCNRNYHRTCCKKLANAVYWKTKDQWTCEYCVPAEISVSCDLCEEVVPMGRILCFSCLLPLISIHQVTDPLELTSTILLPPTNNNGVSNIPDFGKGAVFAHLNVRGLHSKMDEIRGFLRKKIHLFACTETLLNNGDLTTMYNVSNYNFYRFDRTNRKKGGTGYYVKHDCSIKDAKFGVSFPHETEVKCFKLKIPYINLYFV